MATNTVASTIGTSGLDFPACGRAALAAFQAAFDLRTSWSSSWQPRLKPARAWAAGAAEAYCPWRPPARRARL